MIKFKVAMKNGETEVWHLPLEITMQAFVQDLWKRGITSAEIMEVTLNG